MKILKHIELKCQQNIEIRKKTLLSFFNKNNMKLLFIITCVITTLYLLKLLIVSCIKKYNKSQSILSEVSLSLPKCWKDLDEDDLLYVSTLFVNDNTKEDILTKCFIYFADLEVLHQRKDGCWICQKGKEFIFHYRSDH